MLRKSLRKAMFFVLAIVLGTYLLLFLLLAVFQRNFIYYPAVASESNLLEQAEAGGVQSWRDGEGNLIGWRFARNPNPKHRMIIFHGNAGYALHREYLAEGLLAQEDGALWEVFVFEYPGFGARAGTASEQTILTSAEAAIEEMKSNDQRPIYLLGESLGTGVAAQLAGRFPDSIGGVILITPFTSLADVAAGHYPMFPVRLAMRDRFDSDQALRNYHGPVVFLVAGRDDLVPTRLGLRLHENYHGPKRLWSQDAAGHATLDYTDSIGWWREVSDFLLETSAK